ncbi:MAG: UvrD-helicase domain-containing protein [Nanoarchaeota archaeon]
MKLEFNPDGSLKTPEQEPKQAHLDYIYVLKALKEIPFPVGKTLLIEFLQGSFKNKSILKNSLDVLHHFGSLRVDKYQIESLIGNLIGNNLIKQEGLPDNNFIKVLYLTQQGEEEITNPKLHAKKLSSKFNEVKTIISEEERELFKIPFLNQYNDEQKKAIICSSEKILGLAGAGSGKTTVLVKRIEFLVKYKSVNPDKILAITFTRKARQEMQNRLAELGLERIKVETFNSFCEKTIRKYSDVLYDKEMHVLSYGDKIRAINLALQKQGIEVKDAVYEYFTKQQKNSRTTEELFKLFINDCFFVLDYLKSRKQELTDFSKTADSENKSSAQVLYKTCAYIKEFMEKQGLRDFTDQIIDAIKLFNENPALIPEFEHILIDEYQDVNSIQIELIDLLNPKNIFAVGDPRQSIFGWRGSNISYILNFKKKYSEAEVINLTKNYRSSKKIVELINSSIRQMGLPDLEHSIEEGDEIELHEFASEQEEYEFILHKILKSDKKDIFVLARTNRQLKELSQILKSGEIEHVIRTEDENRNAEGDIILATIHAIKGMEAKTVFVIGSSTNNFPCKTTDHPVVSIIKIEEYDKEEEEKRLFYVALSRTKEKLYITHSGKPSYFINSEMKKIIQNRTLENIFAEPEEKARDDDLKTRLKQWRLKKAREEKIPAYCIITDKTIEDLSTKMPQSRKDLEDVHGLGYTKIMKYGEDILDLIS